MTIVPAILTDNFDEFKKQLGRLENIFPLIQIDVADGKFVSGKTFDEIEKIKDLKTPAEFEIHLMTTDPLAEMEKWAEIKNVKRVIFHIEAGDPTRAINFARGKCWQVGLALNPETSLTAVEPYYKLVEEMLFLTVHPGKQGAKFLPEVGKKIQQFNNETMKQSPARPLCAVDGGINADNIAEIKSWGAEIFYVGSALTRAKNIEDALKKLINA